MALEVHSSRNDDALVKAMGRNQYSAASTSSKPSSDVTYGASTRFTRVNVMATFEILISCCSNQHIELLIT